MRGKRAAQARVSARGSRLGVRRAASCPASHTPMPLLPLPPRARTHPAASSAHAHPPAHARTQARTHAHLLEAVADDAARALGVVLRLALALLKGAAAERAAQAAHAQALAVVHAAGDGG